MAGVRRRSTRTGSLLTALVAAGALAVGLSAGVTSAAWVDEVSLGAAAASGHIRHPGAVGGFGPYRIEQWQDVGLPGDPDTFDDGFEIAIPPIEDVLPGTQLCRRCVPLQCRRHRRAYHRGRPSTRSPPTATASSSPDLRLIEPGSIEVENINIGTDHPRELL